MSRLRIAVIFGGRSGEHDVSLRSAASIIAALREQERYDVIPVGITRDGIWLYGNDPMRALSRNDIPGGNVRVSFLPDPSVQGLFQLEGVDVGRVIPVDVVFPVLHGTYGEDGTVQGLLELAQLPYVGAGVLGSAAGMDKILMKAVLLQAGLPVGEYVWFTAGGWQTGADILVDEVESKLGYPCFIKPANLGSSVGISKAYNRTALISGIQEAFLYDRKVLVEKFLTGREIECSVLGNENPEASVPGEIIPCNDFYDYRAKYLDDRSRLVIPAALSAERVTRVRELAVETFIALDCAGLGRVDFFVDEQSNQIWVNELNTLPGFTSISMYPKLWEASGLSFQGLLDRLIDLAFKRFAQKVKLATLYSPEN
jgi:D-alanine-D-alanine ligase